LAPPPSLGRRPKGGEWGASSPPSRKCCPRVSPWAGWLGLCGHGAPGPSGQDTSP
jgi:hypothetical protein